MNKALIYVTPSNVLSDKNVPDSAFKINVYQNMHVELCFNGCVLLFWDLNSERIKHGDATCYDALVRLVKEVNSKYGRHLPSNEDR